MGQMSYQGQANISAGVKRGISEAALLTAADAIYRTPAARSANSERARIAAKGIRKCWHKGCGARDTVNNFRKLVGIKGEYECRDEQACSARIVASWGNAS
jgi:hypothetical protein